MWERLSHIVYICEAALVDCTIKLHTRTQAHVHKRKALEIISMCFCCFSFFSVAKSHKLVKVSSGAINQNLFDIVCVRIMLHSVSMCVFDCLCCAPKKVCYGILLFTTTHAHTHKHTSKLYIYMGFVCIRIVYNNGIIVYYTATQLTQLRKISRLDQCLVTSTNTTTAQHSPYPLHPLTHSFVQKTNAQHLH